MNAVSIGTLAGAALYLLLTYSYFGALPSISESRYRWLQRNFSEAFTIFCAWVSAGAMLQAIYEYKEITKLLLMLAGFFMFAIAIASTFKDKKVSTIHYLCAVLAIALGFAAVVVEHWGEWRAWVPLSVFLVLTGLARRFWPKYVTYLLEALALILIFCFV